MHELLTVPYLYKLLIVWSTWTAAFGTGELSTFAFAIFIFIIITTLQQFLWEFLKRVGKVLGPGIVFVMLIYFRKEIWDMGTSYFSEEKKN
jgi:hypothetical protein